MSLSAGRHPLLDSCPMGVLVISMETKPPQILYANEFFHEIIGTNPQNQAISAIWPGIEGQNLVELLTLPDLAGSHVLQLQGKWLKLSFQDLNWQGQDAILIWADNVSLIKEHEADLEKAAAEADAIALAKSNFLATMSHEMRTPMQSVYGLLELIALEKPSQHILDMANIAKSSASGMLEILDDILDLAKMDADKMELDMFEVPVRTLIRGVLEALSVKVAHKAIKLMDEVEPDVPFIIIGDPKRLRQILINLTGNALKFTQSGFVKIRVTTKTQKLGPPESGINLRFEVIDSGIGINKAILTKLFNNFTQADSSTARKFGGTGLGLSISKRIVEIMGGIIGVESEEQKGSTFWFEIPTEDKGSSKAIPEMPDLKGLSILSVEDHPQGAKEILTSLRSMGASVDSVGDCASALSHIRKKNYDVAVLDQGLPDGLGVDLIRDILEIRPFIGMLMYTVRDDEGLLHSLQTLGVRFLGKPASRFGLGQAVLAAASQSSLLEISGPTRLLIAEDTLSVQDLFKRQLKTLGCEADFVRNGIEVMAALETGKYGVLFTDLHMPEMDGYSVVQKIREKEKISGAHFPVIVLTADIQVAQPQTFLELGFDECLLKPVSLGHFRRLLIRLGLLKETDEDRFVPRIKSEAEEISSALSMKAIIDQMGAFDDSAKEMLSYFSFMTEPLLLKLRKAAKGREYTEVRNIAHSIKGGAYSACAVKLGSIAAKIQNAAESNKNTDELVEELFDEFDRVRQAIHDLIKPSAENT